MAAILTIVDASTWGTATAARGRGHRSGFWAATFAFLAVMAVAILPSPLYGLYRARDHFSALTIRQPTRSATSAWLEVPAPA